MKNNKDYHKKRQKDRWHNNKDKERKRYKAWLEAGGKKNKAINEKIRRARKRANGLRLDDKIIRDILNKNNSCVYCGSSDNLTIEHIIPVSKGGNNSFNNLTVACNSCNCSKQDKNLIVWLNNRAPYDNIVIEKYDSQR